MYFTQNNMYKDLATNLYNKNFFITNKKKFSNMIIENISNNIGCSILFCDIDFLKAANDSYGHLAILKLIKQFYILLILLKNILNTIIRKIL